MPIKTMEHPNTLVLREIEEKAQVYGWPWHRSFAYEVAVAADELEADFPSDKAIVMARAKLHKWMKTTPEKGTE